MKDGSQWNRWGENRTSPATSGRVAERRLNAPALTLTYAGSTARAGGAARRAAAKAERRNRGRVFRDLMSGKIPHAAIRPPGPGLPRAAGDLQRHPGLQRGG